jgi:hypothetical protein
MKTFSPFCRIFLASAVALSALAATWPVQARGLPADARTAPSRQAGLACFGTLEGYLKCVDKTDPPALPPPPPKKLA